MAITWRNIGNTASANAGASLAQSAANTINTGLSGIGGLATDFADRNKDQDTAMRKSQTANVLDGLMKYSSVEDLQAAQQSGDIASLLGANRFADREVARTAVDDRQNSLRDAFLKTNQFDEQTTKIANKGDVASITDLIYNKKFGDARSAIDANDNLLTDTKQSLYKQLDSAEANKLTADNAAFDRLRTVRNQENQDYLGGAFNDITSKYTYAGDAAKHVDDVLAARPGLTPEQQTAFRNNVNQTLLAKALPDAKEQIKVNEDLANYQMFDNKVDVPTGQTDAKGNSVTASMSPVDISRNLESVDRVISNTPWYADVDRQYKSGGEGVMQILEEMQIDPETYFENGVLTDAASEQIGNVVNYINENVDRALEQFPKEDRSTMKKLINPTALAIEASRANGVGGWFDTGRAEKVLYTEGTSGLLKQALEATHAQLKAKDRKTQLELAANKAESNKTKQQQKLIEATVNRRKLIQGN